MMAITPPATQAEIRTSTWGIPITDEVNRMTPLVVPPTAWVNLTLINGWSAKASYTAQYRRIGTYLGQLTGRIAGGTNGLIAFNLPAGFRPVQAAGSALLFPGLVGGSWVPIVIDFRANGDVLPVGSATEVTLDYTYAIGG